MGTISRTTQRTLQRNGMKSMSYPMKLKPCFKSYLWGGTRLSEVFGKSNNNQIIAESWELACHVNGTNIVENGIFQGVSLDTVIQTLGWKSLGDVTCQKYELPILVKLIDATLDLSIQVHPSDETALGDEKGKAEMWYVIDCDPQSYLYSGFSRDITPDELEQRVENGSVCDILNKIPVKKGDVFYILPGTIHAICKGILIAEVQQNSDTTFRVYDYKRTDDQNKTRELHLKRAKEVLNFQGTIPLEPLFNNRMDLEHISLKLLFLSPYFSTYLIENKEASSFLCDQKSFHHILALEGTAMLYHENKSYAIKQGDSFFLPATTGTYEINGDIKWLLSKR